MSHTTRKELLEKMRRRYGKAGPPYKRNLLDQAQELLSYHRKSAIRALKRPHLERAPWIIWRTGRQRVEFTGIEATRQNRELACSIYLSVACLQHKASPTEPSEARHWREG